MFDAFFTAEGLIALLTLTFLEIVLGIDNIIFISIVSNKLPQADAKKARLLGLALALIMRIALLSIISWLTQADSPLFYLPDWSFLKPEMRVVSIRDIILIVGGLFLIAKSTSEIHGKVADKEHDLGKQSVKNSLAKTILQIIALDIVFSFDSILTAVGLSNHLNIMIAAVIISIIIMMIFSGAISNFINKYPTLQVLALSFLIMIGIMLLLDGFGVHVPKGFVYVSVVFSLIVELINIKIRNKES